MTAQVIANPPGSITTYGPDGRIPVEAGVVYRIVDLDSSGVAGPVLDPLALTREIVGEDLQVTLPDGTVLTFEGMLTVLAEGAGGGLAGPDGELAIASLEALVAPAEGAQAQGDTGQGEADDGSSQAFNQAQITDPRQFGEVPSEIILSVDSVNARSFLAPRYSSISGNRLSEDHSHI